MAKLRKRKIDRTAKRAREKALAPKSDFERWLIEQSQRGATVEALVGDPVTGRIIGAKLSGADSRNLPMGVAENGF